MEIEIWYKSAVRNANIVDNTRAADKAEMGKMNDTSAQLSILFNTPISNLGVEDKGIRFEYDETHDQLFCIASFLLSSKPNKLQLDTLIEETTALIDRGYYGDDGWFVDIGKNSYYIDLVDHDLVGSQPYLVEVTTNA